MLTGQKRSRDSLCGLLHRYIVEFNRFAVIGFNCLKYFISSDDCLGLADWTFDVVSMNGQKRVGSCRGGNEKAVIR